MTGESSVDSVLRISTIPTSRFEPVALVRPLGRFGSAFSVELSSFLTLSPDTVMRAALGKSLRTFLDENNRLSALRKFEYWVSAKHRPTATTKDLVRQSFGPTFGAKLVDIDGLLACTPHDGIAGSKSEWDLIAQDWGEFTSGNLLDAVVKKFVELDAVGLAVTEHVKSGAPEFAEWTLSLELGDFRSDWLTACPDVSIEGCIRLESSLHVVASVEVENASNSGAMSGRTSVVLGLLSPKAKPIGNWLGQLASALGCANNRELADLCARRQVLHNGKLVTHDTLKGWSSMKPGMVMTLSGCQSLLTNINDKEASNRLLSRFVLARFLAFLCDFLISSVRAEAPDWSVAQEILAKRYKAILRMQTEKVG